MARDAYHQAVRIAIEKDGWQITHDPLELKFGNIGFEVDLAAQEVIAAERTGLSTYSRWSEMF